MVVLGAILRTSFTINDFRVTTIPTLRTMFWLPVFLIASGLQHDCHHYLSSLKKYFVPAHPLFSRLVSPHYTAECVIYLSLAFLAAPEGTIVNKTLLCALLFVTTTLAVTARNTKQWYANKFGPESVRGKWNIIPGVY